MTRTRLLMAAAFLGIAASALPANAAIIYVTPTFTLQQVMNMPGGLTVLDKTFSNFTYQATSQGTAFAPTPAGINVTGIEANFPDGRVEHGLLFQGAWSAFGSQSVDSLLTFQVASDLKFLSDNTLWMVGRGVDGGMASVSETVTTVNPPGSSADYLANKFVFSNDLHPVDRLIEHVTYPAAWNVVYVTKDIQVNGGTDANGSAAISAVYQTFSQSDFGAPEPGTLAVVAIGAGALFVRRRRVRNG